MKKSKRNHRGLLAGLGGIPMVAVVFLGSGCVALVDYRPDEAVVTQLGVDQARLRFAETLGRAVEPRVTDSQVTDDFYRYGWLQTVVGAWGVPMGAVPQGRQLYFVNIDKIEVYVNNKVFVYEAGILKDQVLFGNLDDAKRYADLVASFRARRRSGG
jgi:hypothetical protein